MAEDFRPVIGSKPIEGPVIRLLVCLVCESIEELPDYDGPTNHDYLLEISLEKHKFPSGDEHRGRLFKVPVKAWSNSKDKAEILEQFRKGGSAGLNEIDPDKNFYETKMQFADEAMECWVKHLQPKDNCDDYETSSKRLLPNTAKERNELGLPKPEHLDGPKVYTCHFCPYHGEVVQRKRRILGMY